jgi:hypothetical protein
LISYLALNAFDASRMQKMLLAAPRKETEDEEEEEKPFEGD